MIKFSEALNFLQNKDHPSLGILLNFLTFSGHWHPDLKSLKARLKLLFFFTIVFYIVTVYIKCALNFSENSVKHILQYTPFHLGLVKCCFFQKDYRSWEELVNYIGSVERKQVAQRDAEQTKLMNRYITRSKSVTHFFLWLAMFSNIGIFAEPYQKNQVTGNETVYYHLFDGYSPFGGEPPGYYYSMIFETIFGYAISLYVICWDMTVVTIMIFFTGQLQISSLQCSRVINAKSDTESQINIAECHKFHTKLVLHQKKFNALISPVMFVYIVIVSINLGVCIIQLTEKDAAAVMSTFSYIFAILTQLLLFYWHGNEVTVESLRVSYSTFKSDWVDVDWRMQKQVQLLASTTNKRLVFKAGPFNEMSLSTFVGILRLTYSFYTLLKETN